MNRIDIIYLKELSYNDEIIDKDNIKLIKTIKIIFKKIVGAITIKKNGIAILPYNKLKAFKRIKIYFIKKVLEKLDVQVVLSQYLNETQLKDVLAVSKVKLIDENKLTNYVYTNIVEYICKIKQEEILRQEITVLVKKHTGLIQEQIIELLNNTKRVQIVTPNIKMFENLEIKAEEITGMPCQITNNKRKSLSKANIIINLDFDEKLLNTYNINPKAIIINTNMKAKVNSKLFEGINIYDYQILYENCFEEVEYKKFNKKNLYASKINGMNFAKIKEQMNKDKLRVVNLIGKNGIINVKEFKNYN